MNFLQLRRDHLKIQHNITFYPYQEEVSNRIINALNINLRLTNGATEDDVKKLKQFELAIEISRQAGKTTAIAHTAEVIMTFLSEHYQRPIALGIFAPQIGQAQISYNILRNALRPIKGMIITTPELKAKIREEENAKKLVLPNGSSCIIGPMTSASNIEGLHLDLIIVDEAQDADDEILKHSIWPMGKTTNAPRAYIGKAGTRICHFYRLGQTTSSLKYYFEDVAFQRKEVFGETKDVMHLIYEQSVRSDIVQYGEESDEIQREYFGKWQIGTGQFTTQEEIAALETDRSFTHHDKTSECFAGIDTAKRPDSTVVTVLRYNKDLQKKEVISWLELQGDNYQDQFDIIVEFLNNYNIIALAIDSTGQGDFMPDLFENNTEWQDEHSGLYRVKFSAVSKDIIYKNLKISIKELLTTLPNLDTKKAEKFKQQMLDLQQEYKGQLLSVHHPDSSNARDDYPDSWALAEYAYAQYSRDNNVDIHFINSKETPNVAIYKKTDPTTGREKVIDYWPGLVD